MNVQMAVRHGGRHRALHAAATAAAADNPCRGVDIGHQALLGVAVGAPPPDAHLHCVH